MTAVLTAISTWAIPVVVLLVPLYALFKRVPLYVYLFLLQRVQKMDFLQA